MSSRRSPVDGKGFAPPAELSRPRRPALTRREERALAAAAARGDGRAMRRLLESVSPPILRFAQGFCRQREDAEDVFQEALAALARTVSSFRGDASLSTWAFTVARNACLRRRRRERHPVGRAESLEQREARADALAVVDTARRPDEALERSELRARLDAAIAALPDSHRQVVLLRDVEGLSTTDVGRVLGLAEPAVKSRLHRARLALRAALAPVVTPDAPKPKRDCPQTARFLSEFLEKDVDAATCRRLRTHVEDCAGCSAACESLRAVVGECHRLGETPTPPAVRQALRDAIRRVVADAQV